MPMRFARFLCFLLPLSLTAVEPVVVKMSVLPGLQFDRTRFAVPPGAKVTVQFSNPDQMIHNFVVTAPGARAEVVTAALGLGAEGPAKNFIPDSKKVLWYTKALNPGETTELTFTAPAEESVLPYVCTSMGHGFVMYGAMYVTTKPLPPLAADPNVPPVATAVTDASDFSHTTLDRIVVSRTFLPDCGPAAIAVGMPGGQSYVFDAGLCRLRYAWRGGYVDNGEHWQGKGEACGKVVGRIYYRAPGAALIRIGDAAREPAARWHGYDLGKDGPAFRYTVDGCEVRERPAPLKGGSGIVFSYAIEAKGAPVHFVTDPESGAKFSSSAGTWNRGVLTLSAEQAANFTLTMTERPGIEPLKYWSMNDLVFQNRKDPQGGVIGRAFTPGGTDGKPKRLSAGVGTDAFKRAGTLMAWVKGAPKKSDAKPGAESEQPIFSAGLDPNAFMLAAPESDEKWHHVALAVTDGATVLYVDGHERSAGADWPANDAEIFLGSAGEKTYLRGLLDEVRLFDRRLPEKEIRRIYAREARSLPAETK